MEGFVSGRAPTRDFTATTPLECWQLACICLPRPSQLMFWRLGLGMAWVGVGFGRAGDVGNTVEEHERQFTFVAMVGSRAYDYTHFGIPLI